MPDSPADYQAEFDINTLRRAEEIKKDPARMTRLKAHAEKVAREMQEVAGKEVTNDITKDGFRRLG